MSKERVSSVPISVVICVYNGSDTIAECLNSLLMQSVMIEVIVVNDGSTDDTLAVLYSYRQKFEDANKMFHVIDQDNRGKLIARWVGLERANGMYMGFVDADDWVSDDMYERLWAVAKEQRADVVSCGFINTDAEGNVLKKEIFKDDFQKVRHRHILPESPPSFCNSIFKRKLFFLLSPQIKNHAIMRGEDLLIVPCLLYYAPFVVAIPEAHYYYRNVIAPMTDGDARVSAPVSDGGARADGDARADASRYPTNLYKDLEGMKDLFKVSQLLAEFFYKKPCIASDLIPKTTKFPEFFNRYNYKYVHKYFTSHKKWEWYFSQLLNIFMRYPRYGAGIRRYLKPEDIPVVKSFTHVFKDFFLSQSQEVIPQKLINIVSKEEELKEYIKKFRKSLRIQLILDVPRRIMRRVFFKR